MSYAVLFYATYALAGFAVAVSVLAGGYDDALERFGASRVNALRALLAASMWFLWPIMALAYIMQEIRDARR